LRGRFNVENVLGVVAARILLDVDDDEIAAGVRAMTGVPGRFEAVDEGQPFAVIVDYAHTPDSLDVVLRSARELGDGRVICVFGAGGDRDRGKRPLMGAVAAQRADHVIVTSDNPRSEDPLAIIAEIETGLIAAGLDRVAPEQAGRKAGYVVEPDRRAAISLGLALAVPGDIVVIAGKGHEDYQLVAGRRLDFDDRTVVRELVAARERASNA
jgi:UDP-N-acetylmuramoyl-L-alanyl-D-glutamate--2,6-diaminopimelate ligase